jgi:competence protein ComEC
VRRVNAWPSAPIARLLIPFCGGITWALFLPELNLTTLLIVSVISLAGYLLSLVFYPTLGYRARFVPGILLCFTLFYCGTSLTLLSKADREPNFFYSHLKSNTILAVRLTEPLQEKAKSFKAQAKVETIYNNGRPIPVSGSLLLYFKKDELSQKPAYGDLLLIKNKVTPLISPRNPGEFDYASYMTNRQVFHSAWLQDDEWKATGINQGNVLWKAVLTYRQKLSAEVEKLIRTDEEKGIAKALLLGEDKELDPHIRSTYAGTGTLHVLSVSGMHVGILFFLLRFFFKPLATSRGGRLLRIVLLLGFLWAYAMLTGLSPSVARSAAMLSLILIGLDYRRVTNIYNIIAASAFGLLLLDPYLLTQVSFQLSYAAILGIVWLQPQIVKHWEPYNWLLRNGWEIIAASIAAQIATFPFGLLYFSQFPTYFLLSNLAIIPISSLALITGCIWLFLASIPYLDTISILPGYTTYMLIDGMNWCAEFLAGLPTATLDGLYITKLHFIILCFAIILLAFSIQYRKRSMLFSGVLCSLVFFCLLAYSRYDVYYHNRLTVHAINNVAALTIKDNGKIYLLADSSVLRDADKRKYHFQGFFNSLYLSKNDIVPVAYTSIQPVKSRSFYYRSPYGQFTGKKFLWLTDRKQLFSLSPGRKFDFIILSCNAKIGFDELHEKIKFTRLILTPDNSFNRIRRWQKACNDRGIACINLKKDYSFTLSD